MVIHSNMHGVCVTEQVVQVAENLLIGPREEDAEDIVLSVTEFVKLEAGAAGLVANKTINLAVGIARHVLQRTATHRLLRETMDRHDREELIDRPAVGEGLKEREIAEVAIDERRLELGEDILVGVRIALRDAVHGIHGRQPDHFRLGQPPQVQHARVEVLARAFLIERRIMEHLEHLAGLGVPLGERAPVLVHLVQQRVFLVGERWNRLFRLRLHVDHLEQEQSVMRGERTPRLADDVRHGQLGFTARLGDRVDHVIGILL